MHTQFAALQNSGTLDLLEAFALPVTRNTYTSSTNVLFFNKGHKLGYNSSRLAVLRWFDQIKVSVTLL